MANESATEIVTILNAAADTANLPRQLVIACAYAESRLNPLARRPSDPNKYRVYWEPPDPFDVSGGLGQKIVRYMPPYLAWCAANEHNPDEYPGDLTIEAMLDLLNDPRHAAAIMCGDLASKWRIYGPSMERTLAAYNWPAGGGAFYSAAHEDNYRNGLKAAANILGGSTMTVKYNPQEPAHPQNRSYDCSQEAAEWAMWSLGRKPDDGWMEKTMIAEGVMSPDQGLLDGSGAGLAAFIVRQYGEFGFKANNEPSVSWAWITAEGGHTYPVLAGGRGFGEAGHWIGVKGYDAARGVLLIANPADGYDGIGQEMTEAQWDARGPWSAVRIWHPDLFAEPAPPPVVVPPVLDRAAVAEKIRAVMALMDAQNKAVRAEWDALLRMVEAA